MKLNLKSKKPATPKIRVFSKANKPKSPPSEFARTVDSLAVDYMRHRDQAQSHNSRMAAISQEIKDLAEKSGKQDNKSKLCFGRTTVIGYSVSEPSQVVNIEKLKKYLPPKVYKDCVDVVETINESALENLVTSGVISRKVFAKCLDKSDRAPVKRVYVATKAQYNKYHQARLEAEQDQGD